MEPFTILICAMSACFVTGFCSGCFLGWKTSSAIKTEKLKLEKVKIKVIKRELKDLWIQKGMLERRYESKCKSLDKEKEKLNRLYNTLEAKREGVEPPAAWGETFTTNTGQKLTVHSKESCWSGACVIHNPSDHHMIEWDLVWRGDRKIFERICPHGIGHPDPDCQNAKKDGGVHGCDGCCTEV